MNKIKTIFMNMSWLMASQIITSVLAFFWTIMIARYLGVDDYGIFGFAVAFSGMLAVLCDLGINSHVVRSIATDYGIASEYLGNALPLKAVLTIFYILVVLLILFIWHSSWLVIYITLLYVIESAIKNICGLLYGVFQAHEKAKYQAIANILLAILSFALILSAIYFNLGLNGITWAYVIANAVTLLYVLFALVKHISVPKIQFNFGFWKKLLIWGIPFALTTVFYSVYYSIDVVMLSQMVGDFATGIYNATYKLISVLALFYTIYSAVIYPVMTKQFKSEKSLLVASFEKSTKYLSMITVPLCIATLFYANDIIQLFFGNQYIQAGSALQVLIWTVCFLFINGAASSALNATYMEYSVTKIYLSAAVFNVVLNFILLPHYSYIGASVATVLSEVLILILSLFALRKVEITVSKHLIFDILKICISSAILGVILDVLHLNMWVAIPVSIVIYVALLFITKTFDDGDKYIIKQIIGK